MFERGLAIRGKAVPRDPIAVVISLNNLASTYLELEDYGKAEPMLRQVVATFENTPSSERARYATSCHNLGLLYYRHSAYQDAEFLLKRALAIREHTRTGSPP